MDEFLDKIKLNKDKQLKHNCDKQPDGSSTFKNLLTKLSPGPDRLTTEFCPTFKFYQTFKKGVIPLKEFGENSRRTNINYSLFL